jgi:hypothetical protein
MRLASYRLTAPQPLNRIMLLHCLLHNQNAKALLLPIREILPSGLHLSLQGRRFRFSVFNSAQTSCGELLVHQDAILNLGVELAERVGPQLLGFVSRRD